jgi:hypothetical protein
MNNFMKWYNTHLVEISWFIIGWLAMCLLRDISLGDLGSCVLDVILIAVNYYLYKNER